MKARTCCLVISSVAALFRCSSTPPPVPEVPASLLQPGELCDTAGLTPLGITFDPPNVIVAPGQTRPVRVIVNPDVCTTVAGTFAITTNDAGAPVATGPTTAQFDLRHATYDFTVTGVGNGTATLTLSMQRTTDLAKAMATLPIEVRDPTVATACAMQSPSSSPVLLSAGTLSAMGNEALVANASLSVPAAAFARDPSTDELAVPPFQATVTCAPDLTASAPGQLIALGPAVAFQPKSVYPIGKMLRRELDFAVPANPAATPAGARLRHIQLLFQSPLAKTPHVVPVANPRWDTVTNADGTSSYVLRFQSAHFGTYQAAVAPDAGGRARGRHLTHRGVLGISMGGGAAATFGLRHHDKFDFIGGLGGPHDWNWLLWYISQYHLGGFCTASNPSCTIPAPNMYPLDEPFAHTQDFNHWWYQTGSGNGGGFDRNTYSKLFYDLAAAQGDPNGQNQDALTDPRMTFFPAGPKATDPFVTGDTTGLPPGTDCIVPVDPVSGDPNTTQQQTIQAQCYASRCDPKNTWTAKTGYFDDEYNPDGALPVISVCDGNRANGASPYLNQWAPPTPGNAIPLSAALAVDLNKNGVRDQNEPIIRDGHETWSDTGLDGLLDAQEPGYDPMTNPDPNQDDYDFQVNPNGAEGNHRYEVGEPFLDYGLDGVNGTPQQPNGYDIGEGDKVYTQTLGLTHFQAQDPHWMLHGWTTNIPAGPITDEELLRLDIMLDGGVRDLFNFESVANHLSGAIGSRMRADGTPLKAVTYYNNFDHLPGEVIGMPDQFTPANLSWQEITSTQVIRYGSVDATPQMIAQGDGQHVGTATQILSRVEASFYAAGHAWPDADRTVTDQSRNDPETTTVNELGTTCEIAGTCEKIFTGPVTGRAGPIAIGLPPGYALEANRLRNVRYPVVFVLHGYGQDPRDLEALALIANNNMNNALISYETRLPKFIAVYVDGRCRVQTVDGNQVPECVRGTFYMNSDRTIPGAGEGGAAVPIEQLDTWFTEVIDYIDANYRTMGASDVEVVE